MPLPSKSSNGLKILVIEVENDLRNIEAVASGLTRAWNNSRQQALNELEINWVAHLLENFYTAIEDLFLRVARAVDRDLPAGDQWHRDLLQRMAYDIPQG
ncbi:MAG: hypothetical protein ACM3TT_04585 [Syntrophothermus sp.]